MTATVHRPPGPTRGRRRPVVHAWVPTAAAPVVGLGLGASVAWPIDEAVHAGLALPGSTAILLGDVTAMAGTYLLLIMVLLAARIPAVEKALGQDRLIRWHRWLSPAPLVLLSLHALFTTIGYAQAGRDGLVPELGSLITGMDWILASVVAYVMLLAIAGISIRAVRRRVSYDTWWVVHLYTYLALAFAVPHQIFEGTNLAGHAGARALWLALWSATAGVVIVYRIGLPVVRSVRHRLEVAEIRPEGPDTYSIVLRGRQLDRLAVAGGQYVGLRVLARGMWWHAHPFSLSALPSPPFLRMTVKVAGDTTARLATLRPGARVGIEGPYGDFTAQARTRPAVALVGAGVGITPLRAILEDLPAGVDPVVVQRASRPAELVHHREIDAVARARRGRLVTLVGPRSEHPLDDPAHLQRVIPDLAGRELYICGPVGFAEGVTRAARAIGVPAEAIHTESFEA